MSRADDRRASDEGAATGRRTSEAAGRHVDLWLRADALSLASDSRERAFDRVRRLHEERAIDSCAVERWGSVDVGRQRAERGYAGNCLETFERFEEWAAERGLSLRPGFQTRRANSTVTDRSLATLLPPVVCLAVRDDGDLTAVFPHRDGDDVVTVGDGFDRLAADAPLVGSGGDRP